MRRGGGRRGAARGIDGRLIPPARTRTCSGCLAADHGPSHAVFRASTWGLACACVSATRHGFFAKREKPRFAFLDFVPGRTRSPLFTPCTTALTCLVAHAPTVSLMRHASSSSPGALAREGVEPSAASARARRGGGGRSSLCFCFYYSVCFINYSDYIDQSSRCAQRSVAVQAPKHRMSWVKVP